MIKSYCQTFGLNYRIMRLCNVYGESATGVSKKRNAIMYSFTLDFILFQLAKIQNGVKKVLSKIMNNEMPSTPTW